MSLLRSLLPKPVFSTLKRFHRNTIRGGYVGLNGLDRRLCDAIKPGRSGYFVELGANDGVTQSNTYFLQFRYRWTGLLIEPCPDAFDECVENRHFGIAPAVRQAACVDFAYDSERVAMLGAGLMSVAEGLDIPTITARQHVETGASLLRSGADPTPFSEPARTLTSILDEVAAPRTIDLLSLDVEGNEEAVLRGVAFDRYTFRWILVELRSGSAVPGLLTEAGYVFVSTLSDYGTYTDALFAPASLRG